MNGRVAKTSRQDLGVHNETSREPRLGWFTSSHMSLCPFLSFSRQDFSLRSRMRMDRGTSGSERGREFPLAERTRRRYYGSVTCITESASRLNPDRGSETETVGLAVRSPLPAISGKAVFSERDCLRGTFPAASDRTR